jgi:NAD-dependent deacetylase
MTMKKLIVLTGAGMSQESGINTFRDANGLWKNHRIEDVASPVAWRKNPQMVLDFYNMRRKQLFESEPNAAHYCLARMEEEFDVRIITQNVDDLHERAGSKHVLHLHGELKKARSAIDPKLIYTLEHWELKLGDKCERGGQLRPHIVWFGEEVPEMMRAIPMVQNADLFLVIGTSLQVYPAAGLLDECPDEVPKYLIDPESKPLPHIRNLTLINEKATRGMEILADLLKRQG